MCELLIVFKRLHCPTNTRIDCGKCSTEHGSSFYSFGSVVVVVVVGLCGCRDGGRMEGVRKRPVCRTKKKEPGSYAARWTAVN